jgi:hypothetical protein
MPIVEDTPEMFKEMVDKLSIMNLGIELGNQVSKLQINKDKASKKAIGFLCDAILEKYGRPVNGLVAMLTNKVVITGDKDLLVIAAMMEKGIFLPLFETED